MRIGISVCSAYSAGGENVDPRVGARWMVERTRAASQARLDSLFVGDHHVTRQPYYQNSVMLGRIVAEWHDAPVGALYLLPLWHPVLLAEQVATLACLAPGRFILQCALGGDARQSWGLGVDPRQRVPMFEDSLAIMRALWAGETVSHNRFWNIRDAHISPLPPEPIDVWVGAVAQPAIQRTARLAQGWLAQPGLELREATDQLNRYRQACAEHNCQPSAVAVRRDIFVGGSVEEANQVKSHYVERGYRGFPDGALMAGSVEQVAEEMQAFSDAGFTDIIVRNLSSDQPQALASIERLAEVKKLLD